MQWERYRDIVFYRAYAELKAEAQLNYMGYVWWLLEPLLNTGLFMVLMVYVLEQQTTDEITASARIVQLPGESCMRANVPPERRRCNQLNLARR